MNYRLAKEEKRPMRRNSETILVGRYLGRDRLFMIRFHRKRSQRENSHFAEEGICQAMDWFNGEGEKMNREV